MGGCLDESTVVAFLEGTLLLARRTETEAHLADCSACADLVTWAAADRANSTVQPPGHEGRPFIGQLQPGARVGRYQVLGAVGRGGMGEVYAAYHPDLDRKIALKVVYEIGGGAGERRGRLLREARAIARLSHPNVVTVHDAGTFDDRVYIAMEFVDGATVDDWLRAAPRSWREILDVFIAAGRGLAAAHAAEVIHRDFKPQNVMIDGRGAVRVMDFGLARMVVEDVAAPDDGDGAESPPPIGTVTKTGALIGTPAYMSPEQFQRGPIDARSDQFSFCVALHEALFGIRPALATGDSGNTTAEAELPSARGGVPSWLRSVLRRGASPEKEKRFPSMDALLAALERGRTRTRRRAVAIGLGIAVLLVAGAGWRLARGNSFACAVPEDRVGAAWSTDGSDARRQTIHRAFATSGRATAETSWQRLSATLDDYTKQWRAMYLQACDATHVRREQSPEVLDLRMTCLNDNLDQVHALTDTLATADADVVSRAVAAAKDLTPVSRCADVALLRSAVPLPRDERTLREVQRLRRSVVELEAQRVVGRLDAALALGVKLRPEIEATHYLPLLAELLDRIGGIRANLHQESAEATLEEALFAAEAAHDDVTAARAAADLVYTVGLDLGRIGDSERWARLANAILDRLGPGHEQIRGWVLHNRAAVHSANGDLKTAEVLIEEAIALKERALGNEHPDVAISLDGSGWMLAQAGRHQEALERIDRAIDIWENHGDPSGEVFVSPLVNRGDVLIALGRTDEARESFERADKILQSETRPPLPNVADVLSGLGRIELAEGRPALAAPLLDRGLAIYRRYSGYAGTISEIEFALARALLQSRGDRKRARALAAEAREVYRRHKDSPKQQAIDAWLAANYRT